LAPVLGFVSQDPFIIAAVFDAPIERQEVGETVHGLERGQERHIALSTILQVVRTSGDGDAISGAGRERLETRSIELP